MKTIRIKRLCLSYFKGIRQASFDFGEKITAIKGCNGSGKSTIVDAISWVLFGTDKDGNTKFGIKTRSNNGAIIQNVTNSVTLTINVDGEEVSLERSLRGSSKDNGSVKNEYIYKINGDIQTSGDFSKFVDSICPISIWRMCSTPLSFTSQDWMEQRRMLTSMFGEPDVNLISKGEKRFDFVIEELKKNSIEKIIKHLNYKRKEVQSQLNEIPTRLEELNKVLPQQDDWESVEKDLINEQSEYDKLVKELHFIEAGHGATIEAAQRRKKLDFAYKRKTEMETGATIKNNQIIIEHDAKLQSLIRELNNIDEVIYALVNKRYSYNDMLKRYEQQKQKLETEKIDGAAQWFLISQKKWEWDEQSSYCPTCKQLLPVDQIEELKKSSQETFLAQLAEEKKKLIDKASQVKENLALCEKEFAEAQKEIDNTSKQIDDAKNNHDELSKQIKELKEEKIPSVDEILANNPSYKMVVEQISSLEQETENKENNPLIDKTNSQINEVGKRITELRERLNVKMQYDNVSKQIDSIGIQRKSLQEQLDEIDKNIANTTTYQRRACEALEETMNKNFTLVKWSMFKRQVDGTDKPWCECSVDGVPFSDLNSAMRINAGIDIINTLKKYYDVDVPCIIDNAETILKPLYNDGQQIRLRVTEDTTINIENEN